MIGLVTSNELNRIASDRRVSDRQTGTPMPTTAGPANTNPDQRKFYCAELGNSMPTTDGPNGMQCSFITTIIGQGTMMPGDPLIKNHGGTSDFGGTYTVMPGTTTFHTEGEMVFACEKFVPPADAKFPYVFWHTAGGSFPVGWYYYLSPTDGPHPGRGPGWPS